MVFVLTGGTSLHQGTTRQNFWRFHNQRKLAGFLLHGQQAGNWKNMQVSALKFLYDLLLSQSQVNSAFTFVCMSEDVDFDCLCSQMWEETFCLQCCLNRQTHKLHKRVHSFAGHMGERWSGWTTTAPAYPVNWKPLDWIPRRGRRPGSTTPWPIIWATATSGTIPREQSFLEMVIQCQRNQWQFWKR